MTSFHKLFLRKMPTKWMRNAIQRFQRKIPRNWAKNNRVKNILQIRGNENEMSKLQLLVKSKARRAGIVNATARHVHAEKYKQELNIN